MSLLGSIIGIGTSLLGNRQADRANQAAAEQAAAAAAQQAAAIREGNRLAQQRFDQLQRMTAPGVEHQVNTIGRYSSGALNPSQERAIENARRRTLQALAISGLRGSGRATTAAVRDVEGRLLDNAIESNMQRAERASAGLANTYFNAANQAAGIDMRTGLATGQGALNAGMIGADYALAEGQRRGRAIGDLGGYINDAIKTAQRSGWFDSLGEI